MSEESRMAPSGEVLVNQSDVKLIEDGEGVGWIVLDKEGRSANMFDESLGEQLRSALARVESEIEKKRIRVVVFWSMKKSFIVGADVETIRHLDSEQDAFKLSTELQDLFMRVEKLTVPTIAVINGACMGGGFELCLACCRRISATDDSFRIGLPEVQLGLIPGAGGTVRLPRLIGLQKSLTLILTGRQLVPSKALRMGLVDALYPVDVINSPAELVKNDIGGWIGKRPSHSPKPLGGIGAFLLEKTPVGRYLIDWQSRSTVMRTTKGKYPAPREALDSIMRGITVDKIEDAYKIEASTFAFLSHTRVAKALMTLFTSREEGKKVKSIFSEEGQPREIEKIGVVGAGVMGSGIAQILLQNGYKVYMRDINDAAVEAGKAKVVSLFDVLLKKNVLTKEKVGSMLSNMEVGTDVGEFASCDVVIESATENLIGKQKIIEELEGIVDPKTIIAVNTSALCIKDIAAKANRKENIVGMHFFNPVGRMLLIEVAHSEEMNGPFRDSVPVSTIYQLALKLKKSPVLVADSPGFLVNRLLALYMMEACRLLLDGADVEKVDRALVDFGMPMGPFRLTDEVGLDVANHVAPTMQAAFGSRFRLPGDVLKPFLKEGRLGKKSGDKGGFYVYRKGHVLCVNAELAYGRNLKRKSFSQEEIVDRCVLTMVNEAARCLGEGIVQSVSELDLALVFGTGFAPFRGGLMGYAHTLGIREVVYRLEQMASEYGTRFEPCKEILDIMEGKDPLYAPHQI